MVAPLGAGARTRGGPSAAPLTVGGAAPLDGAAPRTGGGAAPRTPLGALARLEAGDTSGATPLYQGYKVLTLP